MINYYKIAASVGVALGLMLQSCAPCDTPDGEIACELWDDCISSAPLCYFPSCVGRTNDCPGVCEFVEPAPCQPVFCGNTDCGDSTDCTLPDGAPFKTICVAAKCVRAPEAGNSCR
jgi:hypothetical protein